MQMAATSETRQSAIQRLQKQFAICRRHEQAIRRETVTLDDATRLIRKFREAGCTHIEEAISLEAKRRMRLELTG